MSKLPIEQIIQQYEEINETLSGINATEDLMKLGKQQKTLQSQFVLAQKIKHLEKSISENEDLLNDSSLDQELSELTKLDNEEKQAELAIVEDKLITFLAPKDPHDDNDIFLEIRAGAGGDESALFAADLVRMYNYLCEKIGFKLKIISFSENSLGGYKELIAEIRGNGAYSWFKYEGGVHRVQRVPSTEKQGRIHTSTVSVAVLPLFEESNNDFKLDMKEVEVTASTSQGAGGQSVNTTYSAIKVKHIPTGIEAQSQDERNQQQNKIRALQVLTSRVFDFYEQERLAKEGAARREQVGKADRSEKIRTYNFPQDRLTDHRYNQNWNQLPVIMDGGIYEVIEQIKKIEAQSVLENLN